jgi:hypothetical protein
MFRGRRWLAVCALALGTSVPAAAQTTSGDAPIFLTRAQFSFAWSGLFTSDPRFTWSGRVKVDIDFLDTKNWRLGFLTHYDAVIGGERRQFDLNQGLYILDGTAGRKIGRTEIAFLARHVSRHLVDRTNLPSISWNAAGARAFHHVSFGRSRLWGEIDLARIMQQGFVDYLWTSELRLYYRYAASRRLEWRGTAEGAVIGTMREVLNRPRICGGRIEGAIRINGQAAGVELFAAYERRMDAFPTDRFRVRFSALGFRFTTLR